MIATIEHGEVLNVSFCNKCGAKLTEESLYCGKCGNKVEGKHDTTQQSIAVSSSSKDNNKSKKPDGAKYFLGCFGVLILIIIALSFCEKNTSTKPPKRIEDMTNKEIDDFLKWKEKQNQKKWENEKFIK